MITAQKAAITLERVKMATGFSGGGRWTDWEDMAGGLLEDIFEDSRPSGLLDIVMTFLTRSELAGMCFQSQGGV